MFCNMLWLPAALLLMAALPSPLFATEMPADPAAADALSDEMLFDSAPLEDLIPSPAEPAGPDALTDEALFGAPVPEPGVGVEPSPLVGMGIDPFSLSGYVKEQIGYSYDHSHPDPKLSQLKTEVQLDLQWRPGPSTRVRLVGEAFFDGAYRINGRDTFTGDTLATYEAGADVVEGYVDYSITDSLAVRFGRQFIGWGLTENDQIADVANPRDFREIGLKDLEDARLAVVASKLTYYRPTWGVEVAAIHEIRPHALAARGSEFDPYVRVDDTVTIRDERVPETAPDTTEFVARAYYAGDLGDLSVFFADVHSDEPVLDLTSVDPTTGAITMTPIFPRGTAYGLFGNVASGSWLYKAEVARKTGVPQQNATSRIFADAAANGAQASSWVRKDVVEWMTGVEYSGLSDTLVIAEYLGSVIEDHDESLANRADQHSVSLYVQKDWFNDTLTTTFWWSRDLITHADLFKIEGEYDYSDHIKFTLGIGGFLVEESDSFFFPYRNNGRIYASVQYSF